VFKRVKMSIFMFGLIFLMITAGFGCGSATDMDQEGVGQEESASDESIEVTGQSLDSSESVTLDADYFIDYENGTVPLSKMPIGARVVDPSWEWEYRLGINHSDYLGPDNYTGPGEVKPVTWLVVAKNHYAGLEPHVTLLAEDLIGLYAFDNSTDREHDHADLGYNHWGESGTANATRALRLWLNSSGIHPPEGFYRAFSARFRKALLATPLPNKEWVDGGEYTTKDRVFIPSNTELGDTGHLATYRIGSVYPYFDGAGDEERTAAMVGDNWRDIAENGMPGYLAKYNIQGNNWQYWTRSPHSKLGSFVSYCCDDGEFYSNGARSNTWGVRPALNLRANVLVSPVGKGLFLDQEDQTKEAAPEEFDQFEPFFHSHLYNNYQYNFSDEVLAKLDDFRQQDGVLIDYPYYRVVKVSHSKWVGEFVDALKAEALTHTEKPFPAITDSIHSEDQTLHYWESREDAVFYDVAEDIMWLSFADPVRIPDIILDPYNIKGLESALVEISEQYFSGDFAYIVDEVIRENSNHEIIYRRTLDGIPIRRPLQERYMLPLYLMLTANYKLLEGRFLLAEFEEVASVNLIEAGKLKQLINTERFRKIVILNLPSEVHQKMGEYGYEPTGDETGIINIDSVEVEYYYHNKFREIILPIFVFHGSGSVDIDDETYDTEFEIFTNALPLELISR